VWTRQSITNRLRGNSRLKRLEKDDRNTLIPAAC
jgi:hypothetical protein